MQNAIPQYPALTADEALLEEVRMLILGGLFFLDEIDRDDLPIADRIGMVQDHLYEGDPDARAAQPTQLASQP